MANINSKNSTESMYIHVYATYINGPDIKI